MSCQSWPIASSRLSLAGPILSKIVQSHWHASATETLMEKMGIDWQAKKTEFEAYLKDVEAGRQENLDDPRKMITSGPAIRN